jgi:hypothetical protein
MNNPYIRFSIILLVPLLIGFSLGYIVKPSHAQPMHSDDGGFYQSFPQAVQTGEKEEQESDRIITSRQNAITRAVAKVSPAVVGINAASSLSRSVLTVL